MGSTMKIALTGAAAYYVGTHVADMDSVKKIESESTRKLVPIGAAALTAWAIHKFTGKKDGA